MPEFRRLRAAFDAAQVPKRFVGYSTVNFAESTTMPGYRNAPETFFVHRRGMPRTRENRLVFVDDGELVAHGHVFDIRDPACREHLAQSITRAMVDNGVDAVLLDYAAGHYSFDSNNAFDYPDGWHQRFEENQTELLTLITDTANRAGKEVFCNGMTLDGLYSTAVAKADLHMSACNGLFWEQPFRREWRDRSDDPDTYYDRLDRFFEIAQRRDKLVFVKQGTYRVHGSETEEPGWTWRYPRTSRATERRLAEYFLAFHLLYADPKLTHLIYTHPVELYDVFASEAHFEVFDVDVGVALGPRRKLTDHVFARQYSKALIVLNNSDERFRGEVAVAPGPVGDAGARLRVNLAAQSGLVRSLVVA